MQVLKETSSKGHRFKVSGLVLVTSFQVGHDSPAFEFLAGNEALDPEAKGWRSRTASEPTA